MLLHTENPSPVNRARGLWLRRPSFDRLFASAFFGVAALTVAVFGLVGFELFRTALPSIRRFGWRFLSGVRWDPVTADFGGLPYMFGTTVSSLLALIVAIPISIGFAVFLTSFAPPWMRASVRFLADVLAAIPGVVYGLWGVLVMAPWLRVHAEPFLHRTLGFLPLFQGPAIGVGMLAAGLLLAFMITPTISAVAGEVLHAVPESLREAALALGATPWETVWQVSLPAARAGLVGAVVLGLGRAFGETVAVALVIGNRSGISASLFHPAATMTTVLVNEFAEATSELHASALTEIGLLLFGITLLLSIAARLLVWSVTPRGKA